MIEAIRSVLSRSWAYQSFWHAIGGDRAEPCSVTRLYSPPARRSRSGYRMRAGNHGALICPATEYVGLDASEEYIDQASAASRTCASYARA